MDANFVPIIFFIVVGAILISYFYFDFRLKQSIVERGLTKEEMVELLKKNRNPYSLLKLGIITMIFAIGLGLGFLLQAATEIDEWIPFFVLLGLGAGMIVAVFVEKKMQSKEM